MLHNWSLKNCTEINVTVVFKCLRMTWRFLFCVLLLQIYFVGFFKMNVLFLCVLKVHQYREVEAQSVSVWGVVL